MVFQPGQSGNPAGRPRGLIDRRTAFNNAWEQRKEKVIMKLFDLAEAGDTKAMRLVVERFQPPVKPKDEPVPIPGIANDDPVHAAKAVMDALDRGDISPMEASLLIGVLRDKQAITEGGALVDQLAELQTIVAELQAGK